MTGHVLSRSDAEVETLVLEATQGICYHHVGKYTHVYTAPHDSQHDVAKADRLKPGWHFMKQRDGRTIVWWPSDR